MRAQENNTRPRFTVKILFLLFLLGSQIAILAVPRGSQRPWSKIEPGSLGDVSLFNGTLNMGIPLLDIGGRGETQIPLILRFNKPWTKYFYTYVVSHLGGYSFTVNCSMDEEGGAPSLLECMDQYGNATNTPVQDPVRLMVFPRLDTSFEKAFVSPASGPGFSVELGYGPGMLAGHTTIGESKECSYPPPPPPGQSIRKGYRPVATRFYLIFTTPDGASHELVDQNTSGKFRVNTSQTCGESSPDSTFSRGTSFISTDGSAMSFISDTEIIYDSITSDYLGGASPIGMSGVLKMSNGSQYRIDNGLISWIKDRNGNASSFTYTNPPPFSNIPKKLQTATDSMGRVATFEYDVQDIAPFGLCDRITYQEFSGTNRILRISKTNLTNVLRSGFSLQTPTQMWPATCQGMCSGNFDLFNPIVASAIWLPDGRSYKFKYNSFVEVARVELPTDAVVEFDHDYAITGEINHERSALARVVKEKRIYRDSSSASSLVSKTKFSIIGQSANTVGTSIQTDPNDNLLSKTVSYFYGNPRFGYQDSINGFPYGITHWKGGREYQTDSYGSDGTTLLKRVHNISKNKPLSWWSGDQSTAPANDVRSTEIVSIGFEDGKALGVLKRTEYDEDGNPDPSYFSHLNVKRAKSYHYKALDLNTAQTANAQTITALFSESDLASVSETDYSYSPAYKERGILSLPAETRLLNPSNPSDILAKGQLVYDEAAYFDNSYTTTNWEDPGSNLRGNVTTARTWVKDTNTWLETHSMFDNFGNARKTWDTTGDPFRFVEVEYDPIYKYAYPTKTKAPAPDPTGVHGMTEGSEISRVYDFDTGLLLSVTDANGQTATTEYDNRLRPIRINPPAGGSVSETIYNDTPGNLWVKSRQQIDENNWAESTTFYDNLGRAIKARTKDLQGDVMSQVRFDSFGRVEKTSNPYRVDANGNATEPVYWSKLRYDEQNRVVETFAPAIDGQTGISLGTAQFGISTLPGLIGSFATAIDPSGRKSRAISGIYGLMRVDEATGKGGTVDQDLGTLANPTQPTFYSYNIKGEMTKTTQGSQNRYFMYDSLGRLIRVRQPEQTPSPNLATSGNPENNQWTAGYTYDVLGNVVSVNDAKNITITNLYDKAGRTVKRTYSDGTPEVKYFYDGKGLPQVPQFSRGSLTKVTSSVSEDRFTSFDNHGRLLASQQLTDGQTYNFGYKYNLSGGLLEETYPSGRIVRNFLDSDGGLSAVTSKAGNGLTKRVASDFDYSATGGVKKMKLGNGLWETAQFNQLQQLTQVGLGTTQTNNSLFKVDYEYGELNADGTTVDVVKNIGNIAKATTTIPTTSFVQTFKYDAINRLTEAVEKTGSTQNWIQSFGYDRFGNRTQFSQTVGSTQLPINNITHPTIDQTNNRFTTGQGYVYDFNGNLVQDAEGRSFTFNGDDKQTEVRNASNQVIGRYFYDGSGARVKKIVPTTGETTIFVYDAGGALAAEYSTQTPVANPTTSYLTTDHLGSPRVITDKNGQVISRRDFMPFGEELGSGVGPRTENLKYSYLGSDRVRQRFTGYEKDDETGLDFAEARMYQNKHGRFTAPDPLLASANAANPQTFNRYIYTGNNPVNYTDPSGLTFCRNTSTGWIAWNGTVGSDCAGDSTKVDGQRIKLGDRSGGYDSYGNKISPGSTVYFDPNGTTRVVQTSLQNQATTQGQNVAATTNEIAGGTATEAAASNAASGQNGFLSLCLDGDCPLPSGAPIIIDLTPGATPDEVLDFVENTATAVGIIPGLGEVGDAVSGLTSLIRGDTEGVILSIGALNPFGGQAFGALKLARKIGNAADTVGDLRKAGLKDAHHTIQDASVKNLPGYKTNDAPGVHLPGPSNTPGTPHHTATAVQRQRGGGSYGAERRIGYKALRKAGLSRSDARGAITKADAYFGGLGVNKATQTRIPGNRRR